MRIKQIKYFQPPELARSKQHKHAKRLIREKNPVRTVGLIALAIMLAILSCIGNTQTAQAANCDDVKFIFARGSGERIGGSNYMAWRRAISSSLNNSALKYSFYELGSTEQNGYRYPAVSVGDSWGGFGRVIGALLSGGEGFQFGKSVMQGAAELDVYMGNLSTTCPRTKFVLGGYSQGAQVVSHNLRTIESQKVLYVTTFGDPKLYLPEGKGWNPPACQGENLSDYRAYVPDCRAYEGILGGYQPYEPEAYYGKVGAWCNKLDVMCSSGVNFDDHTAYVDSGLYDNAAARIRTKIKAAYPHAFRRDKRATGQNVTFLFDTSGSMRGYLKDYSAEMLNMAKSVIDQGGKVALVEYRDLGDGFLPKTLTNLTGDYAELSALVERLEADGGGDDDESTLSAALYALNHIAWEYGAAKSLVVVTDAGAHRPDLDGTTVEQVVRRSLEIDPVNISVLTTSGKQAQYRDLTSKTGGKIYDLSSTKSQQKLSQDILLRPEARLSAEEYYGAVGDVVTFDASDSEALTEGDLRYAWDLDGDGYFESGGIEPIFQKKFDAPFSGYMQVRVADSLGRYNTMSAKLEIIASKPDLPQISVVETEQLDGMTYRIRYSTDAEQVLVALNDEPIGYTTGVEYELIIKDISAPTAVRLIPYSASRGRGKARTVELASSSTSDRPESSSSQASANSNDASGKTTSRLLPLAPNTGVPQQY